MSTDREIVLKATPGPWEIQNESDVFGDNKGIVKVIRFHKHTFRNDAQFIAHFNPSKAASMLDRIEALEKENAQLKAR